MWRNFHEDWDRRKTYLIRSLFQEIPLLSPVPEDQESRFGSVSPSDIPGSRPHSPLPALIVERLPSRHDHPPHFYNELERKMKKLYKKLFHHEDCSSSIEDLLQQYSGGDLDDARSLVTKAEYHEKINSITSNLQSESDNTNFVTTYEVRNISECYSRKSTSTHADSNVGSSSASGISFQSDESHDHVTNTRHKDIKSSTETDCLTRVTTQVVVHETPAYCEGDVPLDSPVYEDTVNGSSPIIQLRPRRYHHIEDKLENSVSESEKVSNRLSLGSEINNNIITQQEELSESSHTNLTNESIEIMRRQRGVSPSLGSLQNDPYDTDTSSIGANVAGVKRKPSYELDISESSFKFKDFTFLRESLNFDDILVAPSDNSSVDYNIGRRSSLNFSRHTLVDNVTPTKRIKFGNTAVQTSLPDEDESLNWNTIKNNFFVGIPRIYKLCSCDQHICENQM